MEKKNMVLLTVIAVSTLLVAVVGATFAFFTATVQDNRSQSDDTGSTSLTAGSVASTTIVGSVEGAAGQFTATDVYPGHKEVAALTVTADNSKGTKDSVTDIAIKYDVTQNDFKDDEIKVSIYRGSQKVDMTKDANGNSNFFECHHKSEAATEGDFTEIEGFEQGKTTKFYEECEKDETALTGASLLGSAQLVKQSPDEYLFEDKISANASNQTTVYYYVVVEFVDTKKANDVDAQNASMNAVLKGDITVVPA